MSERERFTPEEISKMESSREESDKQFIKDGAQFNDSEEEKRLELTKSQIKELKERRWFAKVNGQKESELENESQSRINSFVAAIEENDMVTVYSLSSKIYNVNFRDFKGTTPLIAAIRNKDNAALMVLMVKKGLDVNFADKDGHTPLWHAIKNGNNMAKTMLSVKGAK